MKKMLIAAFVVAALAGMTNASAQAVAAKRGGACIGHFYGVSSVLHCEHIGDVTIKQIYEKGFRVVHMQKYQINPHVMLVIEEQ